MVSWDILPDQPITDHVTPPDVYAYRNSDRPVALCLSCACKRRFDGRTVELVGDGEVVDVLCADCDAGRPIAYIQGELLP